MSRYLWPAVVVLVVIVAVVWLWIERSPDPPEPPPHPMATGAAQPDGGRQWRPHPDRVGLHHRAIQ